MHLQGALVILAALGVNGLPTLAPKTLQEREGEQLVPNTGGFVIEKPWCTRAYETGNARRQGNFRWNKLLRPSQRFPQPTQRPPTMKRQRNTEGFWPPSWPNPPKEGPPASETNNKIRTTIPLASPTSGSSPLRRRSAQTTPLERPDRPTQPGQTSSCNGWYDIKEGDTCDTVTVKFNIKMEQFLEWNPAVSKNCDKEIELNFSYCVRVLGSKRAKRTDPFTLTIPTTAAPSITPPFGNGIQARENNVHPVTVGPHRVLLPPNRARRMPTVTFDADQPHPVSLTPDGILIDPAPGVEVRPKVRPDGELPRPIRARATQIPEPLPELPPLFEPTQTPTVEDKSEKRNEIPEITRRQTIECARQWAVGPNDTCESISRVAGISVAELVALNPITLASCDNMPLSQQICLRAGKPEPARPVSMRDLPLLSPTPTIK
ncbi:hypothetical protein, variant 1 [Blastomyces gilchristii SLH14081]|uniref:LysM domain-containing protein n=2 Tax=Blastomyces gilchristii (strain SLH14081) TaxID=559298 RepID=A0A179U7Y9_BLAGS|nr:uncharacterized protein BDBG_00713 [Blastomyces gilchristii SLH14081]XP_031575971.1 hypothetical protein, variant 1 [Blastomyces gilchristii SLH14081]OAT04083.1 hypothetical protein BDBG_00713 [Blastomyces gilchristii SLH14081]OAT04084.1 hypothetical protein, variant 1 [Blastomyces gilchristii SLH14081]